jgi:hypothetical protein
MVVKIAQCQAETMKSEELAEMLADIDALSDEDAQRLLEQM